MDLVPVIDEGLGNSSYVVGLGDGGAMVVDPFRDPAPYLEIAGRRRWRIRFAVETHLHADYVSGIRELAARGAQPLVPAGASVAFDARHVADEEEVDVGGLVLRALATPGHTPEHLAYLLTDGRRATGVFTGGTLIVGGAARPDLLGPRLTEPLARAAYRSARDRLLPLPDDLPVYPTHGAGSFCSAGSGDQRTSTIGDERANNPLLQTRDEDEFVATLLAGLGSYPPYFLELRDVNRAGPRVYGLRPPPLRQLSAAAVVRAAEEGAALIDVRGIEAFAAGHVPGALSNPLRPQFATWLGWLVDRRTPLVLITDERTDRRRLVRSCLAIGYEKITGELLGGIDAWTAAGKPVEQIPLVDPAGVASDRRIVDVRQRAEWAGGHVPGALHVELGALVEHPDVDADRVLLHCGHGERAMTAASLLARAGRHDVAVLAGGPQDLVAREARRREPAP